MGACLPSRIPPRHHYPRLWNADREVRVDVQRRERPPVTTSRKDPAPLGKKLQDEARFLRSWLDNPLSTGAITPSSPALARAMAAAVDPERPGPLIELGPGTGPVTEALLARGVAED